MKSSQKVMVLHGLAPSPPGIGLGLSIAGRAFSRCQTALFLVVQHAPVTDLVQRAEAAFAQAAVRIDAADELHGEGTASSGGSSPQPFRQHVARRGRHAPAPAPRPPPAHR
jgi:hypothetical protein